MPSVSPRRMILSNYETGEYMEVQFNPSSVTIELEAFYNRLKVAGQSHEELQYANTSNTRITFELIWDALASAAPDLLNVDSFLMHLHHPPQNVASVSSGAPAPVLFSWPNWIAMLCASPKLKIVTTRWDVDGTPTYQRISVELEERRTRRLGAEVVRRVGLLRAA